ncbi:MAG: hypothetical protein ACRDBI_01090 [Shewanella sp.]
MRVDMPVDLGLCLSMCVYEYFWGYIRVCARIGVDIFSGVEAGIGVGAL